MKELEPGVIRATLDVQNKHQAVVDVVYTNQSFDINYVSSRNLLSQGARIHRGYNTWVWQLETSIYNNLGYAATAYKNNPIASAPAAIAPATTAFDPVGIWNIWATYTPTAGWQSFCPKQRSWTFELDYRKRGGNACTCAKISSSRTSKIRASGRRRAADGDKILGKRKLECPRKLHPEYIQYQLVPQCSQLDFYAYTKERQDIRNLLHQSKAALCYRRNGR